MARATEPSSSMYNFSNDARLVGIAAYSLLWPAIGLTRSLYLKKLYVPETVRGTGIGKRFRRRPRHRHRRDASSLRASASNSTGTSRATLAIKSTGPATGFQFGNGPSKSHAVYEGRVDPGEFIDHQRTPPPMGASGAEPETVVRSQPVPPGKPGGPAPQAPRRVR
jgi:hypothetical protein